MSRVIVNFNEITSLIQRNDSHRIQRWLKTIFVKYMINKYDKVVEVDDVSNYRLDETLLSRIEAGAKPVRIILDDDFRFKVEHMIDYMNSYNLPGHLRLPHDLRGISVEDMFRRTELWSRWMERESMKIDRTPSSEGTEVVANFGEYKLVRILTPEALKFEGNVMAHCIGNYEAKLVKNKMIPFSIRDNNNVSHVTFDVSFQKRDEKTSAILGGVYGFKNTIPSHKYRDIIFKSVDFVHNNIQNIDGISTNTTHNAGVFIHDNRIADLALIDAVFSGTLGEVKELLDSGYDKIVNAVYGGRSALGYALCNPDKRIYKLLLNYGAKVIINSMFYMNQNMVFLNIMDGIMQAREEGINLDIEYDSSDIDYLYLMGDLVKVATSPSKLEEILDLLKIRDKSEAYDALIIIIFNRLEGRNVDKREYLIDMLSYLLNKDDIFNDPNIFIDIYIRTIMDNDEIYNRLCSICKRNKRYAADIIRTFTIKSLYGANKISAEQIRDTVKDILRVYTDFGSVHKWSNSAKRYYESYAAQTYIKPRSKENILNMFLHEVIRLNVSTIIDKDELISMCERFYKICKGELFNNHKYTMLDRIPDAFHNKTCMIIVEWLISKGAKSNTLNALNVWESLEEGDNKGSGHQNHCPNLETRAKVINKIKTKNTVLRSEAVFDTLIKNNFYELIKKMVKMGVIGRNSSGELKRSLLRCQTHYNEAFMLLAHYGLKNGLNNKSVFERPIIDKVLCHSMQSIRSWEDMIGTITNNKIITLDHRKDIEDAIFSKYRTMKFPCTFGKDYMYNLIKYAMRLGFDPNAMACGTREGGMSATSSVMQSAIAYPDVRIVKYLVKHGGDVNLKNKAGTPAFFKMLGVISILPQHYFYKYVYINIAMFLNKRIDKTLTNSTGKTVFNIYYSKKGWKGKVFAELTID